MDSQITVNSFEDLHEIVSSTKFEKSIWRGVRDAKKHVLIPSVGRRRSRTGGGFPSYERRLLKMFKEMAVPYLNKMPRNDLEWLIIAQHHGLPTRLLDWSYNPLVAAYFAVERHHDDNSAIYIYTKESAIDIEDEVDPFSITRPFKLRVPHISKRITAQQSVFTIQPNPRKEFHDPARLHKISINNEAREAIKEQLYRYNIGRASLFPGLDGLAQQLDWVYSKLC